MNLRKSFITASICIGMMACSDRNEVQPAASGYFKISQIQTPSENGREKTSVQTGPAAHFDLGTIKASKEFYFLLENGGDSPIFDIELSTDNEAVAVSPKKITTLASSDTDNIIPLISIGFNHGTALNGVGFTDVMPMGTNSAILTITGKIVVNGDTIALQTQVELSAFAELMDIQLFDNQTQVDLLAPAGSVGLSDYTPLYKVPSGTVRITNTGNVDIHIAFYQWSFKDSPFEEFTIAPGETSAAVDVAEKGTALIELDGSGTIADHERLSIGVDGNGHLAVSQY